MSCPQHEEADTKIVYRACNINYQASIVIKSVDTDVAVIMLGHIYHLHKDSSIWILAGTGNNLRYVDLTEVHTELGKSFRKSLSGFHEITGCDDNPAFVRKGKLLSYKIFKKKKKRISKSFHQVQ